MNTPKPRTELTLEQADRIFRFPKTPEKAFAEMQQAVADAGFIAGYLGGSTTPHDVAERAERLNRWVMKIAHQIIDKHELPK